MTLKQEAVANCLMVKDQKSGIMTNKFNDQDEILGAFNFLYVWGSSEAVSRSFEQNGRLVLWSFKRMIERMEKPPKKCEGLVVRILWSSWLLTRAEKSTIKDPYDHIHHPCKGGCQKLRPRESFLHHALTIEAFGCLDAFLLQRKYVCALFSISYHEFCPKSQALRLIFCCHQVLQNLNLVWVLRHRICEGLLVEFSIGPAFLYPT